MKREALLLCAVVCWLGASSLAGQSRDVVDDSIPLRNWTVPYEQISARVMETQPRRIAELSLHPSVNAVPSAASYFITVVPCRIVDTRNTNSTYGGPKLVGGTARSFAIPGGPCPGLPVAAAYSLNLTVTQPEADNGFLKAYPTGSTQPLVSTLNFNTNDTKGNAAIVPADGAGSIDIFTNVNTHLIVDINGYFAEGVVTSLTAGTGMTGGGTGNVTLGIAAGGVGTAQLATGAVTTAKIANGAVGTAQIANAAVGTAQIANLAVGTAQLADASVTSAKIAADAVGTREILVPSGQGVPFGGAALTNGTATFTYSSPVVTLAQAGVCMASAQAQIIGAGARSQSTYFRVAVERAGVNGDDASGFGFYFPAQAAAGYSDVQTRTAAVSMIAGQATRFGCAIFSGGDRTGDTAYCFVSWVCF